jgi:transcriptional regulator with XRE-family HTH domain
LQFNKYLKTCRERYDLTQEQLVQELYNADDEFSGLNTGTLSRWERGSTRPSLSKQVSIIKLFQKHSTHFFPCFYGQDNVEDELCRVSIKNLIGNSKEHILKFPTKVFTVDDIKISHIRSYQDIELMLKMPHSIMQGITSNYYQITMDHLESWALHPTSLFLIAECEGQFFGMLFALRLKPDVFNKIISFEMKSCNITENDFASFEEKACSLPIGFFAYNEKTASLLFLRYYAHLIANQDTITEVGATPILDGARKLVEAMHLKHLADLTVDSGTLSAYSAPLEDVLINQDVVKMIFQKQENTDEE